MSVQQRFKLVFDEHGQIGASRDAALRFRTIMRLLPFSFLVTAGYLRGNDEGFERRTLQVLRFAMALAVFSNDPKKLRKEIEKLRLQLWTLAGRKSKKNKVRSSGLARAAGASNMLWCAIHAFELAEDEQFRPYFEPENGLYLVDLNLIKNTDSYKLLMEPLFEPPYSGTISTALNIQRDVFAPKSEWAFWGVWYQSYLVGQPLDWDLQEAITLIPDADWEQGAAHIAGVIEGLKADMLAKKLPLAEEVKFETGVGFYTTPSDTPADEIVTSITKQLSFALRVALRSNCGMNETAMPVLYIREALNSCQEDPNGFEQNLALANDGITDGIASSAYHDDDKLTALAKSLATAIEKLRAYHPIVAETWATRIKFKLKYAKDEQKQLVVEFQNEAKTLEHEKYKREMDLDAIAITQTEGEMQQGAIRRFFGRIAQMQIYIRTKDLINKVDASTGYRLTRMVGLIATLLKIVFGA